MVCEVGKGGRVWSMKGGKRERRGLKEDEVEKFAC